MEEEYDLWNIKGDITLPLSVYSFLDASFSFFYSNTPKLSTYELLLVQNKDDTSEQ